VRAPIRRADGEGGGEVLYRPKRQVCRLHYPRPPDKGGGGGGVGVVVASGQKDQGGWLWQIEILGISDADDDHLAPI